MIIRCDNCSVSLQLEESKTPEGNFTVRCPRCQNLIRVQPGANGNVSSTVQQLEANTPAASVMTEGEAASKDSELQINKALRSLLEALQKQDAGGGAEEVSDAKSRRLLLCAGEEKRDLIARPLVEAGFKVYLAQTPAQANERMRDGKTEIIVFSPDFAAEFGGAAILQQKMNALYSSERRRVFLVSVEDNGSTMNAHEAFIRNLNLIVNTNDIGQLPLILNRALSDFNELYQHFNKANGAAPL